MILIYVVISGNARFSSIIIVGIANENSLKRNNL